MIIVLSDMAEPLGNMVGNSIEVIEAIETLKGKGPDSFRNFCYDLVSEMLVETKVCETYDQAKKMVQEKIKSGEALNKFKEMIIYQHGDPSVINDYSLLPSAKSKIAVVAKEEGYIKSLNALEIGIGAMLLGAGRENKDATIDLGVGVEVVKKVGDKVEVGDTLAYLYSNGKNEEKAYEKIYWSYEITKEKINKNSIILEVIK
jgi:pyrimidine-nucleoside phosphorylase